MKRETLWSVYKQTEKGVCESERTRGCKESVREKEL